jgi:hypothetical protein
MDDQKPNDPPWYSPDYSNALHGKGCTPRPREHIWTLVKAGRRIDAELLSQGEAGWEIQLMHNDGTEFFAWRFPLKGGALAEAEAQHARLTREGWTAPVVTNTKR